ncbi:protein of unknown function [Paraburkholderia dioscoreae]|uniref:Uncharacterized protein n=1 Tax=Paraburkholderia dioscoreae TaxID=2604047 RepID=A0A5Q4Z9T7_9BURK|nr:protein of unknown function [Paraburkholderia dioscoreae]
MAFHPALCVVNLPVFNLTAIGLMSG